MPRPPRTDDLFKIFPDLPSMRKRTAAEQVERVHRQIQDTRQRASENIVRQRAALDRVREAIAGRGRRSGKP